MNIFVIDKAIKENIRMIDFIPRREERIVLNTQWKNLECKVACVTYVPKENAVLIFDDVAENLDIKEKDYVLRDYDTDRSIANKGIGLRNKVIERSEQCGRY